MLRVNVGGKEWRILWEHQSGPVEGPEGAVPPMTECRLYSGAERREKGDWDEYGCAHLHPKDRYNRETGRKVSLAKAIKGWDRADRKAVWEAYLNRRSKGGAK